MGPRGTGLGTRGCLQSWGALGAHLLLGDWGKLNQTKVMAAPLEQNVPYDSFVCVCLSSPVCLSWLSSIYLILLAPPYLSGAAWGRVCTCLSLWGGVLQPSLGLSARICRSARAFLPSSVPRPAASPRLLGRGRVRTSTGPGPFCLHGPLLSFYR